jgi:hypothetical protein
MSLSKHRHNNTLLHQQHRRHDQPGAASMSAASGPPTPAAAAAAPLPCCCYEEARSPQCGRHLVAARDLPPGQVVIAHAPFAAVLLDDQVSARCDFCFAPPASQPLMRCARSKLAHYDSQAHQRAAWRAYYKHECAALVDCAPRVPPASVRLAARVLWRRARCARVLRQWRQRCLRALISAAICCLLCWCTDPHTCVSRMLPPATGSWSRRKAATSSSSSPRWQAAATLTWRRCSATGRSCLAAARFSTHRWRCSQGARGGRRDDDGTAADAAQCAALTAADCPPCVLLVVQAVHAG